MPWKGKISTIAILRGLAAMNVLYTFFLKPLETIDDQNIAWQNIKLAKIQILVNFVCNFFKCLGNENLFHVCISNIQPFYFHILGNFNVIVVVYVKMLLLMFYYYSNAVVDVVFAIFSTTKDVLIPLLLLVLLLLSLLKSNC